jgi:hypothetical protein
MKEKIDDCHKNGTVYDLPFKLTVKPRTDFITKGVNVEKHGRQSLLHCQPALKSTTTARSQFVQTRDWMRTILTQSGRMSSKILRRERPSIF